jgi:hypothetical protein
MSGLACNYKENIEGISWNDLYLNSNNDLQTVSGVDDLVQTCANELWLYQKEYEFNTTLGIPYKKIFNNLFMPQSVIKYYLSTAIMNVNNYLSNEQLVAYGIDKIVNIDFSLDRNKRELTATIIVLLNNGLITTVNI